MITVIFMVRTIADAYDLGIIRPIDQELGFPIRQFIQSNICRVFVNN